jgi:hypothetical protein
VAAIEAGVQPGNEASLRIMRSWVTSDRNAVDVGVARGREPD